MKLFLLVIALPILAADPAGFQVWTASDLQARAKTLKLNQYQQGVERLQNWGNHSALLEHLEGATPAEVHETLSDVFIITSGETALIAGGVVVDPANGSAGEIRGRAINGGVTKQLVTGDIAYIPAKTPHQLKVEAGKQCTYFILKVRVRVGLSFVSK